MTGEGDSPKRFLIKPLPMILGLIAGAGVAVLLQQFAVTVLTMGLLIGCALGGAVLLGIGLPTMVLNIMLRSNEGAES